LLNWNSNDTSWNWNNGTSNNITYWANRFWESWKSAHIQKWNWNIIIPNSSSLNPNQAITISLWLKLEDYAYWPDGSSTLLRKDWSYLLELGDAGTNRVNNVFWWNWWVSWNTTLDINKWYNLTTTYDWTNVKTYVNGILDNSWVSYGWLPSSSSNLYIWNWLSEYFPWWFIDDVRIYNRSLSQDEVYWLFKDEFNNNTSTNLPFYLSNPLYYNPNLLYSFFDKNSDACKINDYLKWADTQTSKADLAAIGDPVNLATWEFDYENTLMNIPWKKLPYEFKISYKNQTYYNWPLWINWDHNYNIYLSEESNQNILFYNWKLWVFRFLKSSTWSTYEYNVWLKANLSYSWWLYTLNYDNWDKYYFNVWNKISKLEDRYSNELNFSYTWWLLSQVTDTLWRNINYSYDDNRLKNITDFNWNKAEFSYYTWATNSWSTYDLKDIKINNWTWSTKTINFEYSTWWDDTSNHNITKLYDSKWQTYVTNTYVDDRVKTQEYWTWIITYNYTLSWSQVIQNTVTDKVWNLTDYYYNSNWNNTSTTYHTGSWDLTYNYTYDSSWYLLTQTKPLWNWTRYTYDSRWNIMEKREKADTTLLNNNDEDLITTYRYTDRNQVKQINYPNGTITTNTYDEAWNLIETTTSVIKDSDLNTYSITKSFEYNTNWELIKSIDWNWNEINYTYSWWLLTQTTSWTWWNTRTSTISYNSYWIPKSITDARWNTTNYEITEFNQVWTWITSEWIVKRFTYDENNNKTKEELVIWAWEIKETNYIYNILDELIWVNEEYDQSKNVTTNIKYDNNWNIIEKTTWSWAKVKYTYNNFAKVTQENVIVNPSDNSKDLTTNYEYDNNWNIIKKTDPRWKITSYEYDRYDRLTKEIKADNTYTTLIYNKDSTISQALKYSQTNVLLWKTAYFQNWIWKIVKEITYKDPVNNSWAVIIKTDYDKNWNIIKKTDPKWNITTFSYDEFNNLIQTQDSLWNKIINTYDKNNNIVSKKVKQSNNKETTTTYLYDDDNRLLSKTKSPHPTPLPEGEGTLTKTYTYNKLNQVTSITDEEGNVTNYTYDYAWKVKTENKVLSSWNITTSYTYDERWNMLSVTDGKLNTTNYEYDNLNRLVKQIYPDSTEVNYTYDKNSNIKTKTDPNWTTVTNTYDDLDRLVSRTISTWSWVSWVTSESYVYDDLWRLIEWNDSNNHNLSFTYDWLNRLLQENQSWSIVGYSYDNNNNLLSIANPNNNIINYTYDDINRVTSIKKNSDSIADYTYTWLENTSIALWNSTSITKTYDELSRLSSLNNLTKTYNYSYDDVWNITSDSFKNYDYDEIYRLTWVSNSWGTLESLSYDKVWNRLNNFNALIWNWANYDYITNNLNQYTTLSWSVNRYVIEEIISELEWRSSGGSWSGEVQSWSGSGSESGSWENNSWSGEENTWSESWSWETNSWTWNTESGSWIETWSWNISNENTWSWETESSSWETNTWTTNEESSSWSTQEENSTWTWEETNSSSWEESWSWVAIWILKKSSWIVYWASEEESGSWIITYSWWLVNFDDSSNYTYDNNWNIINNWKYKFIYDYKNRIVEVTDLDDIILVEYSYDILDRRYKKESNNKLVEYTFSNENILQEQITNSWSSTITKEYINWLLTDDLIAYDLDSVRYYFNLNHLGSVDGISDNLWTTLISYEYDSYWNAFVNNSWSLVDINDFTWSTYDNDRLFTWREYDSEINLYYLRARYYDSNIWRFISRDPIDISDDVNLYAYVGNNPVNYVDLEGLKSKEIIYNKFFKDVDKAAFIWLNITWLGGELMDSRKTPLLWIFDQDMNFEISSYMLSKFMYWKWNKDFYWNNHFISKKVMKTNFYKDIVSQMVTDVKSSKSSIVNQRDIFSSANWAWSIYEYTDFWTSFWTINWKVSWFMNEDWSVTVQFNIKDVYKFNYLDWNWEFISNPFNVMWKYYQDRWNWTPFEWEMNIVETYN
jgi:RHS repeat-associated protein